MEFRDKSEWVSALEEINLVRKQSPWVMARMILWGIENFCRTKSDIADLYDEISEQLQLHRHTLQNYTSVARRFPPGTEYESLEIGHHAVVVGLEDAEVDNWLTQAAIHGWSVARLRMEVSLSMADEQSEPDEREVRRSKAVLTLTRIGIDTSATAKTVQLRFPSGEIVTISSSSDLDWRVA